MASKATLKKMKEMFNGDLPIVNAKVTVGIVKTPKEDGSFNIDYIEEKIPVEVMSVHFNTGMMRVRYIANIWGTGKEIESVDIPNTPYFESLK